MRVASLSLTSGVGGRLNRVQGIMTVNLSLMSHELKKSQQMRLGVLVCDDVKIDIIIGLPSIKAFNLLPALTQHIEGVPCCEICRDEEAYGRTKQRREHDIRQRWTHTHNDSTGNQ